ncbi:hypothetical protein Trco_000337 [Trichoderma cornu-damae]|uniref:WHIM1 domain-containing protein n=1 Tax=Trichoderma cornu-damae TaxID=654480 RepID=A0A9P8QX90_9HYPO|nr:hypothetical protein Trco_000337 [Trichoderma cornu-damae]
MAAIDDDDSSDLSSLSSLSPIPSDDELDDLSDDAPTGTKAGILKFFPKLSDRPPPKEPSPPPRKRSPSPPHEYVLADNPDIALQFLVMFRSRFSDAFPKSLAHFGPQELERDVVEPIPGDRAEHFLCAVLGLLLNRKQDVKAGHYARALEDAIASHKNQWPPSWEEKSPLSGGATFSSMNPTERLNVLRNLVLWAMSSSDALKGLINQSYKQNRHEDDINQPRAVQPWGSDGDKRRYFLVEGQDDTAFRVYRESNPAGTNRTWWSVAGSIEELKALAEKLETKDGGPKAKKLSQKILQAIPRFEAGDEKRKRREYRQMRKEQFKRPEPGFSLYEGRTRGKRMKYTYSDDEDIFSDSTGYRRSARNTGTTTPAETGPVTTASGRTVRAPPRLNVTTGEDLPGNVQPDNLEVATENPVGPVGRPRRSVAANSGANGSMDTDEEESEAEFGDDEDDVDAQIPEETEDEDEFKVEAMDEDDLDMQPQTLVVKLSVTPPKLRGVLTPSEQAANLLPASSDGGWKGSQANSKGTSNGLPDTPTPNQQEVDTGVSAPVSGAKTTERHTTPEAADQHHPAGESPIPSVAPATSLAFRGSPEKQPAQLVSGTINISSRE